MDRGGSDGSFVISGSLCKQTLFLSVDSLSFNQGVDALFVFFGGSPANVIYLRVGAAVARYCLPHLAEKDRQRNPRTIAGITCRSMGKNLLRISAASLSRSAHGDRGDTPAIGR